MATYYVCVSVQDADQPCGRNYENNDVELDLKKFNMGDSVTNDIRNQLGYQHDSDFVVHFMQRIWD